MTLHRSRLCHVVVDCDDLDAAVTFWANALGAVEEPVDEQSQHIYRRLKPPDSELRILLQHTLDTKTSKNRTHIDLETDNVEAEVSRLETLGAKRWDFQQTRGYEFWVLQDPWGNEFCVLQAVFPRLLEQRKPWDAGS